MGPVDSEGVEHGDGVERHVSQEVRHVRAPPLGERRTDAGEIGHHVAEVAGQADVTVVEADREEAACGEALAPLGPVGNALAAEAVDQQQGRVVRVAERLVEDRHVAVRRLSHGPPR